MTHQFKWVRPYESDPNYLYARTEGYYLVVCRDLGTRWQWCVESRITSRILRHDECDTQTAAQAAAIKALKTFNNPPSLTNPA